MPIIKSAGVLHSVSELKDAAEYFIDGVDGICFIPSTITNEALPQTDEVYTEDGALIAIANDRWTPIEPVGTMP